MKAKYFTIIIIYFLIAPFLYGDTPTVRYSYPSEWKVVIKENGDAQFLIPINNDAAILTIEKTKITTTAPAHTYKIFKFLEETAKTQADMAIALLKKRTFKLNSYKFYTRQYLLTPIDPDLEKDTQLYSIGIFINGDTAYTYIFIIPIKQFKQFANIIKTVDFAVNIAGVPKKYNKIYLKLISEAEKIFTKS